MKKTIVYCDIGGPTPSVDWQYQGDIRQFCSSTYERVGPDEHPEDMWPPRSSLDDAVYSMVSHVKEKTAGQDVEYSIGFPEGSIFRSEPFLTLMKPEDPERHASDRAKLKELIAKYS